MVIEMKTTIQARLDLESAKALQELVVHHGWSASEAVRQGIRLLAASQPRKNTKLIGQGQFDSGIPDLATNKKHMEGFGR